MSEIWIIKWYESKSKLWTILRCKNRGINLIFASVVALCGGGLKNWVIFGDKTPDMGKVIWKPGTMIYPLPAVMVSCGTDPSEYNIITISWTGTICTDPAMCYISVRPERHSYGIIKKSGEYVINLTTRQLAYAADWCGVKSGRNHNKFAEMGLTPVPASKVKAPVILESPVNIECIVKEITELGTHHMFISEVVAVNAEDRYIDEETGLFKLNDSGPICYSHGQYYETGHLIGRFGFSVEKKKKKKSATGKRFRK
jgi:flavin reductase (DIM6/NTAB) family NADH-FMN oxidoreductase RutF